MLLGREWSVPVSMPVSICSAYVPCHIFPNPADGNCRDYRVLLQKIRSCTNHASTTFHQYPIVGVSLYSSVWNCIIWILMNIPMSAAIHSLFCCTPKTTLECIPQNKTSVTVFDHYLKKKKKKKRYICKEWHWWQQ